MNQLGSGSAGDRTFDVGAVAEAISTDDIDVPLYQIESLCMRCHENGTTRILFTKIPHFRKILLSAFECPHCGERNNEVQFGGKLKFPGRSYKLQISSGDLKMLNRQVVKSDSATIKIPEIDFEIPPEAQRGSLSTVEGILTRAADELLALQEERRRVDPQTAEAIDKFLLKLKACATGELSFTLLLDDPAGNSFIENPFAPSPDPSLTVTLYERTPEQLASLGYQSGMPPLEEPQSESDIDNPSVQSSEPRVLAGATSDDHLSRECHSLEIDEARICYSAPEEVDTFPSTCGLCATRCETRMFVTGLFRFESFGTHTFTCSKPKQKLKRYNGLFSVKSHCCQKVIVMASSCDSCGYRNSELKPGGRIPDKGKRITLSVRNANDLSRDVIKSDTAIVKVPELDFSGTFGGVVTTVEGLMAKISENLKCIHGFTYGDSLDDSRKHKWEDFRTKLHKLLNLEETWTLILDDALANSFVAPATDNLKDDDQLTFEEYERSWEQNEELGLNDMDTSSADAAYDLKRTTAVPQTEG